MLIRFLKIWFSLVKNKLAKRYFSYYNLISFFLDWNNVVYFCSFSGSNWRNLCDIETNNSRLQHNVIFFLTFGLNFPMLKKNISKNVYYQISILTIYLQLLLIKENLCNNPNFILKFGY